MRPELIRRTNFEFIVSRKMINRSEQWQNAMAMAMAKRGTTSCQYQI
jgi:hypothetical protein